MWAEEAVALAMGEQIDHGGRIPEESTGVGRPERGPALRDELLDVVPDRLEGRLIRGGEAADVDRAPVDHSANARRSS